MTSTAVTTRANPSTALGVYQQDIMSEVFSYFDAGTWEGAQDVVSMLRVCKAWSCCRYSISEWELSQMSPNGRESTENDVRALLSGPRLCNVKALVIGAGEGSQLSRMMLQVFREKMTRITLTHAGEPCSGKARAPLMEGLNAGAYRSLRSLTLSFELEYPEGEKIVPIRTVTHLGVCTKYNSQLDNVDKIREQFPSVRSLSVRGCCASGLDFNEVFKFGPVDSLTFVDATIRSAKKVSPEKPVKLDRMTFKNCVITPEGFIGLAVLQKTTQCAQLIFEDCDVTPMTFSNESGAVAGREQQYLLESIKDLHPTWKFRETRKPR
jgi:hypothetical protein